MEKVLDYRQQEEDMIQQELTKIQSVLKKEKEKLNKLVTNKCEIQTKLKEKESNGINLQQAVMYRDHLEVLAAEIEEQKQVVAQIKEEFEKCRSRLLDKTKECKMLNKLKERQFANYKEEFLKEEQKNIDELATNNFIRQADNNQAVI
ncbi:flagellar export protein FliJ [Acetohalobium arabaticum]|nr:flagellar export protein FliJ [Acetohalobium arabaticum]